MVPGSKGPKDKYISKLHSNTSLTLKKVHLVFSFGIPKVGSIRVGTWGTKTLIFSFGAPKVGSIRVGVRGNEILIFSFGTPKG